MMAAPANKTTPHTCQGKAGVLVADGSIGMLAVRPEAHTGRAFGS